MSIGFDITMVGGVGSPLGVYRINSDQLWLAASLDEALQGSSELFGVPMEEIADECFTPTRMELEELHERSLEDGATIASIAQVCEERLQQGFMPPLLLALVAAQ